MLSSFTSQLKSEFKGYNKAKFTKDLMAGITVAAVALPLALAFGVSSGADAAAGLITAIIAGFVMSLLAGGYYQISGPTGAMAAILTSLVIKYGINGVFVATFLAGVLLFAAGVLHLGRLTSFIPAPVITGFTSGIAVIIALGQTDNFFGTVSEGASAIEKLGSYISLGFKPDFLSVGIGAFVVVFMLIFPKKLNAVIPASLLSIIITTAVCIFADLNIASVGTIPQTLLPESSLKLSVLTFSNISRLIMPAFSIAALGMIESLLCGASAGQMTGVRLDSNQELIAQGIGNMLLPFFGGIPATAAIARTSVAIRSGAQTRLTGIFHSVGLLVSMFALAPVMSKIPMSALAGVLMVTAWRMNDWKNIRYIFSHKFKGAIIEFIATMLATIIFDLTVAIAIGVLIGLIFLVLRLSFIEINYEKVDTAKLDIKDAELIERYNNAIVAYITGPMIFANTQSIADIEAHIENADTLFLSMRGVSNIDISCAQTLRTLIESLRSRGIDVALCGLPAKAYEMMKRTDLDKFIGEENFYWSVASALITKRPLPDCRKRIA